MTVSMYDASVGVFREGLEHSSAMLMKARSHAEERGMDLSMLINGRLYPDMDPLTQQVRCVAAVAMNVASKLAGVTAPLSGIGADAPGVGFDDCQAWIRRALDFLGQLPPDWFFDAATRQIIFPLRNVPCTFTGKSFLLRFGLPNFFFHSTVLYAILRYHGVPLEKSDFALHEFDGTPATFT
jgi:uncharacterized protein